MRNIFLFIRRYFNFLLFLFLQILSIYYIVSYGKYHEAAYGEMANQFTGKINKRYSNIQYYFNLKQTNDSLVKANENLYNLLREDYGLPDSTDVEKIRSIMTDSSIANNRYHFIAGRIVANAVNTPNNFMVLEGGEKKGFAKGMGVVDIRGGVAGIITETSKDFSVVMSLLHKDSRISGKILKTGETGTVTWDGTEPNVLYMNGISQSVKVAKGDSIVTSGFSTTFPKGLLIGTIDGAFVVENTNFIRIKIKTHTNFYNIQYGYVLQDRDAAVINKMLQDAYKQMQ